MDELRGIWADDTATYLVDMRHPVVLEEWKQWQLARGRRPDSAVSERERRQFDREMVRKYREICPPPARTKWQLLTYDILDQQEDRKEKERRRSAVTYERVYVDVDI